MYDKNQEIMHHIKVKKGDIGKYVILPGDPLRTDLIASFLDEAQLIAHNREHRTWTGYLDGEKVSVTSTGMGAPSAAIAVEELIKCGAHTLIRIGTAGKVSKSTFDEELQCVICNSAVRDEGTSLHYIPIEYPAISNRFVVDALSSSAKSNKVKYLEGIVHSKESFYGQIEPETMPTQEQLSRKWTEIERGNVLCTEMETSILLIVASIRQVRAASIMNFKDLKMTIKITCDAIRKLIKEDTKEL